MYPTICIELADDYVNQSTFEEDMRENFTFSFTVTLTFDPF